MHKIVYLEIEINNNLFGAVVAVLKDSSSDQYHLATCKDGGDYSPGSYVLPSLTSSEPDPEYHQLLLLPHQHQLLLLTWSLPTQLVLTSNKIEILIKLFALPL